MLPAAALAGCVAFAPPPPGSACAASSAQVERLNRAAAASAAPVRLAERHFDPALWDPALAAGALESGGVEFLLRAPPGEYFLEVFLIAFEEARHSFVLDVDGAPADTRYQRRPDDPARLRPKNRPWPIALLAMAKSPARIAVRTDAPSYALSAIRWTPRTEFEARTVPRLLRAARERSTQITPATREVPMPAHQRRDRLEQLSSRLILSTRREIRDEALLGLTKSFYWQAAANAEPRNIRRARQLLAESLARFPRDLAVRQMVSAACRGINQLSTPEEPYCGKVEPVAWPLPEPPFPPGAPEWAVQQRRLKLRLEAITRWWVDERQRPNGELGGGWGDDVEILRSWGPLALGLGSETAARGMRRLADGVWRSGALLHGYEAEITDVEHSAEPTTDTQPLLAALLPDDPEVMGRLAETAGCAKYWITQQPDGFWRFRSTWFNCREADLSPARAVDVFRNNDALGPALWRAYFTRDAALVDLLAKRGTAWLRAVRDTAHGKPAGAAPPAIRSAGGSYLVDSDRWDKPNVEWDYFQSTRGAQGSVSSYFLALADLTGERQWMDALGQMFAAPERRDEGVYLEWRRRRGEARPPGVHGARANLGELARAAAARYSTDFDMYTREVMHTDRVYYRMPPEYLRFLFGGEPPRGDRYPMFAVTWPAAGTEFARAVLDAGETSLLLLVYSFAEGAAQAPLRVWRLRPGRYQWRASRADGVELRRGEIVVSARAQLVTLPLPARTETLIEVKPAL